MSWNPFRPLIPKLVAGRKIDKLVALLGDRDGALRERAADALARMPGAEVTSALIAALEAGQAAATTVLGRRGDPSAIAALVAALGHPQMSLHQGARAALVQLKATPALRTAMREGGPGRLMALRALVEIAPEDLGDLLREALASDDSELRRLASQSGARPLAPIPDDPDALTALGRAGDPEGLPHLEAALGSTRGEVRRAAADAIGLLGAPSPTLERLLADPDPSVRAAGIRALRQAGEVPSSVEGMLEDPDPFVRSEAARALALRPSAISALSRALARGEGAAAYSLGLIGDPAAVPALVGALYQEEVAGEAAMALGMIGDRSAIPALEGLRGRTRRKPHPPGEPDTLDLVEEALAALRR